MKELKNDSEMSLADKVSAFISRSMLTAKGIVKVLLQSRRPTVRRVAGPEDKLIVLGNGPSLRYAMENEWEALDTNSLMAVNFAANADEFFSLKPEFYILADPVFFRDVDNANVKKLWKNFAERIDWPMTLFVPVGSQLPVTPSASVAVQRFNPIGIEGFKWFERLVYSSGRGMPRPRNVLIPAIMTGIRLGFKTIYLAGADHSWSKTLSVTETNTVVSIQPHFYADNKEEHDRVASVYKDIRLHEIMYSFHVAFKSYFTILDYAKSEGVEIYNSTPGSFIDAFERRPLGT